MPESTISHPGTAPSGLPQPLWMAWLGNGRTGRKKWLGPFLPLSFACYYVPLMKILPFCVLLCDGQSCVTTGKAQKKKPKVIRLTGRRSRRQSTLPRVTWKTPGRSGGRWQKQGQVWVTTLIYWGFWVKGKAKQDILALAGFNNFGRLWAV